MTLNNRRFALRCLRKLFDVLEDRLHAGEVKLRQEIQGIQMDAIAPEHVNGREKTVMPAKDSSGEPPAGSRRATSPAIRVPSPRLSTSECRQGEPRRRPGAPHTRRKHVTASAFDLRFSS